jgi:hypothetical protein
VVTVVRVVAEELLLPARTGNDVAGVVVDEPDAALVERNGDLREKAVDQAEVRSEVEALVKAEVEDGLDLRGRESVGPPFQAVRDPRIRPQEVVDA